ncbi:MAG: hypothetical protein ACM3ZQ_04410, partial [Bacillota bacterium]
MVTKQPIKMTVTRRVKVSKQAATKAAKALPVRRKRSSSRSSLKTPAKITSKSAAAKVEFILPKEKKNTTNRSIASAHARSSHPNLFAWLREAISYIRGRISNPRYGLQAIKQNVKHVDKLAS